VTRPELEALVDKGESSSLELKKSTAQRAEAAKAVCAMLGADGGFVLFGVRPDGQIRGQELGDRTLEEISGELRRIEPPTASAADL
jgi:predicted HTH transcriptional regulator